MIKLNQNNHNVFCKNKECEYQFRIWTIRDTGLQIETKLKTSHYSLLVDVVYSFTFNLRIEWRILM